MIEQSNNLEIKSSSELLIGIDFGTTNTIITSFNNNNKIDIISDGINNIIPTKVGFLNNQVYCGNYIPSNCTDIFTNFKLDIDKTDNHNLLIYFFTHLYNIIKKYYKLDSIINIKCVITIPSNFNDKQRKIIKSVLETIGFIVLRVINEPSAAALAYGLNYSSNREEKILVLDIGGGTTDITVLQKTDLFFEIIHSEGINNIGGNNFTECIYNDILNNIYIKELFDNNSLTKNYIWNNAQNIKEKLSYLELYNINIGDINYNISRKYFESMIQNIINIIKELLENINKNYPNINYTILVGGTNKMPIIQNIVKLITNNNFWIYPELEYAIATGAGLYAGIIENKFKDTEDIILLDILPLAIGIELADGTYSIIIPQNTPLPIIKNKKYTTNCINNNIIKFKIYQGNKQIANKNLLIDEIIFDKVSIGGVPIIDITFKVDLNSIISIIIKDKKSGNEDLIIIKNNYITKNNVSNYNLSDYELNNDIDEDEIIKLQTFYKIKLFIETCLYNINNNNLLLDEDKNIIINKIINIEKKLDNMNNLELLNTLKYLNENFILIGSTISLVNENNNFISVINDDIITDNNKSMNLLTTNIINDNINSIEENKCYKNELYNLCIYLKSNINSKEIILDDSKIIKLLELINNTLILINNNINDDNNYWYEKINYFNEQCTIL